MAKLKFISTYPHYAMKWKKRLQSKINQKSTHIMQASII